jgi:hypothetical protein
MIEALFGLWTTYLAIPFVFYGLSAFLFIAVIISMSFTDEYAKGLGFWATLCSLALLAVVGHHFGITWTTLLDHPALDAGGIVAYFVIGIVWSFTKWYFYLSNVREKFQTLKIEFAEKNKIAILTLMTPLFAAPVRMTGEKSQDYENVKADWEKAKHVYDKFFAEVRSGMRVYKDMRSEEFMNDPARIVDMIKPQATKHKAAITEWIAFWPMSLTWTMLNDPIRKIVNYLFSRIKGKFQNMSDTMFRDI